MPFAIGDVRVASRGEQLIDQVVATGSLTIRGLGGSRAGEIAIHRFLRSPYVSVGSIIGTIAARTAEQCAGRHILAVQDTTEINFAGASLRRRGFGPAGNGRDPGFFIHPVIAVDVDNEAVIGLIGAQIWTRAREKAAPRRSRAFEEKESVRWLNGCETAAAVCAGAESLTMVADRECDIYELFTQRPSNLHIIIRSGQDRALVPPQDTPESKTLFETLADAPVLKRASVRVAPRGPGDKGRDAKVEIRSKQVLIARPRTRKPAAEPDDVALYAIEVREIAPPEHTTPLLWRLLTSHTVEHGDAAAKIVALYRLRWRIEQVFRTLKSDGLQIEDSQVTEPERMFRLAAVALVAAVRTIQLVDARDGSPRPASDVVDPAFATPLRKLTRKLEGKTERQKNPHPPESLAAIAWIAARLGGWNCYYRPPGPKTMRKGWDRLAITLAGYALAISDADP